MFRLFLLRKDIQPAGADIDTDGHGKAARPPRNSRAGERRDIGTKQIALASEQTFLSIKDISLKGISAEVPRSAVDSFSAGQLYEAHLRHSGTTWKLDLRLVRKHEATLGFEFRDLPAPTRVMIEHLMRPFAIGSSLAEVDAHVPSPWGSGSCWFHGDHDSDLVIWQNESGQLMAWLFRSGADAARWSSVNGLSTGRCAAESGETTPLAKLFTKQPVITIDTVLSPLRCDLVRDVFTALTIPEQETLLESLLTSLGEGG
jgi:hypothetical protein